MRRWIATTALAFALCACSAQSPEEQDATSQPTQAAASDAAAVPENAAADRTLTLDGLGALKLGEPVPADSGWALRGAQVSESCLVYTSPDYDSVYAIVTDGAVRRITVGDGSDVTFVEGIGPGATRAAVDGTFPGFRESPAKYVEGGKDLIAPGADSGDPAVRFELDAGGTVTMMHVGTMPVLGYVEGCA